MQFIHIHWFKNIPHYHQRDKVVCNKEHATACRFCGKLSPDTAAQMRALLLFF